MAKDSTTLVNSQQKSMLVYVSSITPFAVDIAVSVSSPSTVECVLAKQDPSSTEESTSQTKKQLVSSIILEVDRDV